MLERCRGLTRAKVCVMVTRIIVQRKRFKRFRKVEWQTAIAAVSAPSGGQDPRVEPACFARTQ